MRQNNDACNNKRTTIEQRTTWCGPRINLEKRLLFSKVNVSCLEHDLGKMRTDLIELRIIIHSKGIVTKLVKVASGT